jgi:hypothetical protein
MECPTREQIDFKIEHIIDHMDFERIQVVMKALEWTWNTQGTSHPEKYYPSINKLKDMARQLAKESSEDVTKYGGRSCGGFAVSYRPPEDEDSISFMIDIKFCVEDMASRGHALFKRPGYGREYVGASSVNRVDSIKKFHKAHQDTEVFDKGRFKK